MSGSCCRAVSARWVAFLLVSARSLRARRTRRPNRAEAAFCRTVRLHRSEKAVLIGANRRGCSVRLAPWDTGPAFCRVASKAYPTGRVAARHRQGAGATRPSFSAQALRIRANYASALTFLTMAAASMPYLASNSSGLPERGRSQTASLWTRMPSALSSPATASPKPPSG